MTRSFAVDNQPLLTAAESIRGRAGELGRASSSLGQVSVPAEAFGKLEESQAVAGALRDLAGRLAGELTADQTATGALAGKLDDASCTYLQGDGRNARNFKLPLQRLR